MKSLVCASLVTLIFSGCTVNNNYTTPSEPPTATVARTSLPSSQTVVEADRSDQDRDRDHDADDRVPDVVRSSFQKSHPKAQIIDTDRDVDGGRTTYKVKYIDRGVKKKAVYRADGRLLRTELDD